MVGGQLMRTCTSRAPASRTMRTILREVVPRTIESSMRTTRRPFEDLLDRVELDLHPDRADGLRGWMKVRPT